MSDLAAIPPTMSTTHATHSMTAHLNTSNASNGASSLPARIILTNIGLPSRPTSHDPWAVLQKPLVIKPTVCTRYDMAFVYSNGPAFHQQQAVAAGGGFSLRDFGAVKRARRVLSGLAGKLCRKLKVTAAKLSNICTPQHR